MSKRKRATLKDCRWRPDYRKVLDWLPTAKTVVCGGDMETADRVGNCSRCGELIGYGWLLEQVPERLCVACGCQRFEELETWKLHRPIQMELFGR